MDRPLVMGILNTTPDSFHAASRTGDVELALNRVREMLLEGADIIDIGAYSSRPGAVHISEKEESSRLIPILYAVRERFPDAFISIDTFRSAVAFSALEAGADIINDISAGEMDPELPRVAARFRVPYIAMHKNGDPQTMQQQLTEGPVLESVLRYFATRLEVLKEAGLHDILLDPGFGFGKTLKQNYELVLNLRQFRMLGCPIMVGVSRKSLINRVLGTTPETALNGTTALHAMLLERGADVLRVHDVKEAAEAVKLFMSISASE